MKKTMNIGVLSGMDSNLLFKGIEMISTSTEEMVKALEKATSEEEAGRIVEEMSAKTKAKLDALMSKESDKPAESFEEAAAEKFKEIADALDKAAHQQLSKEDVIRSIIESSPHTIFGDSPFDDCGCAGDSVHYERIFFGDVVEELDLNEKAISQNIEGLELVRTREGGITHADGQLLTVTPELLGSEFVIVSVEPKFELIAVPMHIAIQAFEQNNTIVIEHEFQGERMSVEVDPAVSEEMRPFVHFDALLNGLYFIKKESK